MDVSFVILTMNSADYIGKCLDSVFSQTGVSYEAIVVDNASKDNTLEVMKGYNCRVVASKENLGFGPGNNAGFAVSRGRYIYLLNSDAWLIGNNSLAELCRKMDGNPKWGMVGTKVLSLDGSIQALPEPIYPAQRHVHRDFSKLPGKIAWLLGASMFVRREVYEKLGGFDPLFFPIYSEETDFCLRVRQLGYEIGYTPEIAVTHVGGSSEDPRDPYESSMRKLRGLIKFRQKHYTPEDCVFLAKRDLRRARFRMFWSSLLARLQAPKSRTWRKYRQYQGIWEVSRQYLSSIK
jgi:N-acetylglucosaminyl-diphospho-decaprenol L-rhamnosyltransferase